MSFYNFERFNTNYVNDVACYLLKKDNDYEKNAIMGKK